MKVHPIDRQIALQDLEEHSHSTTQEGTLA
jgi:hypothetical protein